MNINQEFTVAWRRVPCKCILFSKLYHIAYLFLAHLVTLSFSIAASLTTETVHDPTKVSPSE